MSDSHQKGLVPATRAVPRGDQATVWSSYGPADMTGFAAPGGEERDGQSLWSMIDDRLRGRWPWCIVLAALLGTALAVLGYRSTTPKYESVGVIRVISAAPITLEGIPESQIGNFSMLVNTQIDRLRSRRVLENATTDEELEGLDLGSLRELQDELVVAGDRNSEFIYVRYESESPVLAQKVVNAVIRSYDELYGQADSLLISSRLSDLQKFETEFKRELTRARSDIGTIVQNNDNIDPVERQQMNLEKLSVIDSLLFAAERARDSAEAAGTDDGAIPDDLSSPQILSRLEQMDPELAIRRRMRDERVARFDEIRQHYRETASAYQIARRDAETAQRMLEEQQTRALAAWEEARFDLTPGSVIEGDYVGWPVEALDDEIAALEERKQLIIAQNSTLQSDIRHLQYLREDEEAAKANLERTRERLDGLTREEKNVADRIEVEQEGYRPLEPSSDGRLKRAVAGMMLGGGLSFGLFFLIGTVDRRAFGIDQLRPVGAASLPPVLGVLPDLRNGELNPETSDVAAHCVHQIRNQVEARREDGRGYVLVVTSPFQGDGKTSIALALGWSYAVGGYKCLMVDCDLVGRSLSRQVGLGGREGLKEAVVAGDVGTRPVPLPVERLEVLPVGQDPRFGPESVRRDTLAVVFEQLRDQYELIVVDTGPLLGALETIPAAAAADGVVVSVRRGRSRSRLEDSIARLKTVGANCLGVIMNCATRADCYRSVSEASISAPDDRPRSARRGGGSTSIIDVGGSGDSNPLVMAMEQTTGEHAYTSVDP